MRMMAAHSGEEEAAKLYPNAKTQTAPLERRIQMRCAFRPPNRKATLPLKPAHSPL